MSLPTILLVFLTITELALLGLVIVFFMRLRKSEALVNTLQAKQEEFLNKLRFNTQLEQEMIQTFQKRQAELANLDMLLDEKSKRLKAILKQAEKLCSSPQFLREVIISGHKEGKSPATLARATGLTAEEVEIIIDQARG